MFFDDDLSPASMDLLATANGKKFATILADPPWQFQNRTGKVAPEHKRLNRYGTMTLDEICELPVEDVTADPAHLYLWVPNALLPDGLRVMKHGDFATSRISSGTKSVKTAAPMVAVSASISVTLPNFFFSERAAKMPEPSIQAEAKST